MANKDDYLTYYREFFENFAQTVNPNDQLPVKLASYKLVNIEIVGGIIDWTTQYLTQKQCPPSLFAPLIRIIIDEIRKACKKHPVNCGFNPADNAYEPLKLMQTVMAKTNEVCLRYLDNSMLCSLPSPIGGSPYYLTSVCAVKNIRRRMEDRHVIVHDLNTMFNIQEASPSSYYAIFDGHAGHDAAAYGSAHLHQYLAENEHFVTDPKQALLDAFCKTDALFIDKCEVEHLSSGTTAVVALLRPKEKILYVAWAGDSQALLVSRQRALQLVNPHKPCREDERERIEKRGGCVVRWGTWRVNGQLAVSRAIGDPEYKPFVIAVPDIQEILLDDDDFIVLACDGLWDSLSEETVARTVYNLVMENPDDTERISQRLVHFAKEQGSTDNISVIVVFLREPSKIAAEAHWANRNLNTATMEEGFNNANNPFAVPNGATTDNIITQKSDGLLLNLNDKFRQNGTDLSPPLEFFSNEKSNGKRSASDFDDDDFGPETDIDTVDDVMAPDHTDDIQKSFGSGFSTSPNSNPLLEEGVFNPFMEHQEKAALEMEKSLRKRETRDIFDDEQGIAREETPTPPADAVHDVSGLVENPADSESEDEWNYIKGEEANKENISPQPEKEVADIPEEDDTMSQLNPNAAEFVPVSPTRSIPSPACRMLINDQIVSQSPKKANDVDISLPNLEEFAKEVKSRPSEIESCNNGHNEDDDHNITKDLMENILNGKNIDEIPEFQPGSTPKKVPIEEFHFGPNSSPWTPRRMDQSEALSTKAVYGDESEATLGTSFNESVTQDPNILNKESDPMSMSFYADKGESNPFDLNKVQPLPDNLDEFLNQPDNETLNETISDLPEHHPLGEAKSNILNNDDAIQTTDLDKHTYDDEKELASPLEPEKELLNDVETDLSKTPEPTNENLLQGKEEADFADAAQSTNVEFCYVPEGKDEQLVDLVPDNKKNSTEGIYDNFEVSDLMKNNLETLPQDVELLSNIQLQASEPSKLVDYSEIGDLNLPSEPRPIFNENSPVCDKSEELHLSQPSDTQAEIHDGILDAMSPTCDNAEKTYSNLLPEQFETKSPICDKLESDSYVCDLSAPKSPMPEEPMSAGSEDFTRPEFLHQADERFEELCKPLESPQEEITSSVKDDLSEDHMTDDSSVAKSLSPNKFVEDHLIQDDVPSLSVTKEGEVEVSLPVDTATIKEQPLEPALAVQNQSAESTLALEIISFQDQTLESAPIVEQLVEPSPHITSSEVEADSEIPSPKICICPPRRKFEETEEEIPFDVKTENIAPEFAEPTIVTPSEESKTEELAACETIGTVKEELAGIQNAELTESQKLASELETEMTAVGVASAVAAGAAITAVVSEKKTDEKKKPAPTKKTAAKPGLPPAKGSGLSKSPIVVAKTSPRLGSVATPKPAARLSAPTPKTGTPKPATSVTTTSTASKSPRASLTKAKSTSPATKAPPAKPSAKLTNGEAKPAVKSTLNAKKVSSEFSKLATKPLSSATSKTNQSKLSAKPQLSNTQTSIPPRTVPSSARSATTTAKRPTTLTSKSTTGNIEKSSTVGTIKSVAPKVPPRLAAAPQKSRSNTGVPPKPRVPLTKTITKVQPDTEKQIKESANKITASRNITQRTTVGSTTSRTTTTVRRVEAKVSSARTTVTKSTTSTTKTAANMKKPAEIMKTTAPKTKTTKIEKPKENGISTVVIEEITVVNSTNATIDNQGSEMIKDIPSTEEIQPQETELIKDNSPVDNKVIETQFVHANAD